MIVFCNIGLPGFAVSIAVPVVGLLSLLISLVLVDKVSVSSFFSAY